MLLPLAGPKENKAAHKESTSKNILTGDFQKEKNE